MISSDDFPIPRKSYYSLLQEKIQTLCHSKTTRIALDIIASIGIVSLSIGLFTMNAISVTTPMGIIILLSTIVVLGFFIRDLTLQICRRSSQKTQTQARPISLPQTPPQRRTGAEQKQFQREVYQETLGQAQNGQYTTVDGKTVQLDKDRQKRMKQGTVVYTPPQIVRVSHGSSANSSEKSTKFTVKDEDCLEAAFDMRKKDSSLNPVVLNMANAYTPGGGVENGARAQEESIFRRSDYALGLCPTKTTNKNFQETMQQEYQRHNCNHKERYYIAPGNIVYTPEVQVFRNSDLSFKEAPETVAIIAAAAVYLTGNAATKAKQGETPYLQYEDDMSNRIRAILRCAIHKDHNAIVLSAFGCGAFHNNPVTVAKLFDDIFKEPEFKNVFQHVCFAIIDDHNSNGNFQAFKNRFTPQTKEEVS